MPLIKGLHFSKVKSHIPVILLSFLFLLLIYTFLPDTLDHGKSSNPSKFKPIDLSWLQGQRIRKMFTMADSFLSDKPT